MRLRCRPNRRRRCERHDPWRVVRSPVRQECKMIDHMGIPVSDVARSRAFYEAALGPLGMSVQMEVEGGAAMGFGVPGEKIFWIGGGEVGDGIHVAFRAERRDQ